MAKTSKSEWMVPLGLVLLSVVPILAGSMRLVQLMAGADVTPENARFFGQPLPVIIHIIGSSIYSVLGAFQFSVGIRRRWPKWHRYAGRLLIGCGLLSALSGLWMTQFYAWPAGDGYGLYLIRLGVGTAMILCIILGLKSALVRDINSHKAWMMRGYALGLGAGTQALTHLPWFILYGKPDELPRTILMGLGWGINIAVVEWIIANRAPAQKLR